MVQTDMIFAKAFARSGMCQYLMLVMSKGESTDM